MLIYNHQQRTSNPVIKPGERRRKSMSREERIKRVIELLNSTMKTSRVPQNVVFPQRNCGAHFTRHTFRQSWKKTNKEKKPL